MNDGLRVHKQNVANFLKDHGGTGQTVGGTANALTVTGAQPLSALTNGFRLTVPVTTANTGSMTLAYNSLTAKTVKKYDNTGNLVALIPNDNAPGLRMFEYLSSPDAWVLLNPAQEARYPPGTLYGLTLSNNGSDATNDIDIAVGSARDSTDAANIDLASALTKRIDASWAVGTNQGGLDGTESVAGTPDTSTWYHVWLIKRPDTGVVDVLFSESATAPTMPTNYTLKRRIGSVYNDSSGNIKAFTQNGDEFTWTAQTTDYSSTSSRADALLTLTVPTGIVVKPLVYALFVKGTGGDTYMQMGLAAWGASSVVVARQEVALGWTISYPTWLRTNTSAQVYMSVTLTGTLSQCTVHSVGWIDTRGRL